MDEKQKRIVYLATALLALALLFRWWLSRRATAGATQALTPPAQGDFSTPLKWPTPGIYPNPSGFQSVIDVNFGPNINAYGGQQYVPTFGLIGMVGVRGVGTGG